MAKTKIVWPGSVLEAPLPAVLVTCGTMDKPNVLSIGWTGVVCTDPPLVYVSIRPKRYSYGLIKGTGELVINLTTADMARAVDRCGVYTGAKMDKFADSHLTPVPASQVGCPLIEESPLSLECRVKSVTPLGTHDMFLCEVVAVDADEALVDENGKLCMNRANLLTYAHGEYFAVGKSLGTFGFAVKKKKSGKQTAGAKKKPTATHAAVQDKHAKPARKQADGAGQKKATDKPKQNKPAVKPQNKGGRKNGNHS